MLHFDPLRYRIGNHARPSAAGPVARPALNEAQVGEAHCDRAECGSGSDEASHTAQLGYETILVTEALKGRVPWFSQLIAKAELPVNVMLRAISWVQLVLVLAPPEYSTAPCDT